MFEVLSAVAAISAAIIALAALVFTAIQASNATRQTRLQQKIREDTTQPYVWADIRLDPRHGQMVQFVVKNEGPTVATDVQISIDPPLKADWMLRGNQPHGPHEQSNRFASIPPGRQMVWNLAVVHKIFDSPGPHRFTVTITSAGPYGAVDPHTYVLDLADYRSVAATAAGTLLEITKSVKELTEAIKTTRKQT